MEEESYQEKPEYEKQEQEIHTQIQTIIITINQLKQDVDYIKDEVEEMRVKELLEKMNLMMDKTDDHLIKLENEIDSQKEDFLQLKEAMNKNLTKKTSPRPSEYRTLQKMMQSSNSVELSPSQHAVSRRKGTKTFRNPQHELNKNIITRSSTSRNRKK